MFFVSAFFYFKSSGTTASDNLAVVFSIQRKQFFSFCNLIYRFPGDKILN